MARHRGQVKGHLCVRRDKWLAQWREDVRLADGSVTRRRFSRTIALAKGKGKVSKREAQRIFQTDILSKLDEVSIQPTSMATVAEFVEARFRPDIVEKNKSDHYTTWLTNWVLPRLGKMQLRMVRYQNVQQLADEAAETLSRQSVQHIVRTVKAIFKHARRCEFFVGADPAEFVILRGRVAKERRAVPWAKVSELMARLPEYRELILTLAVTGLRIGEACALTWRRVNLTDTEAYDDGVLIPAGTARIDRTWKYYKGGWRLQDVKSTKGRRLVPLPPRLIVDLQSLRERSEWTGADDPVFPNSIGGHLYYDNVLARKLEPAAKAAKVPWVTWHCLRHTAETIAEQHGMTLGERMKLHGRSSAAVTMDYNDADPERARSIMSEMMDRLFEQPGTVQ